MGPYNDSSVQRYPGSDEEDCEEDCEFTFDDDSGDGVSQYLGSFFNTGISLTTPDTTKRLRASRKKAGTRWKT